MKLLLGILFLSLSLLSGCQQQKTDYERGYNEGQKVMIDQFWQKMDAEAQMWEEWRIEAENSIKEAKNLKKWGVVAAVSGTLLFLISLSFANATRKTIAEEKIEAEKDLNLIVREKDEAIAIINSSELTLKEAENAKKELSELKTQIINLKKEIETLSFSKKQVEKDYETTKKRLDEISI